MSDWSILEGDCLEMLRFLGPDTMDTIITDPPYHLTQGSRKGSPGKRGFMGKTWDGGGIAFEPGTWEACFRVAKPGAFLLAFGGTRTFHRLTCAIEDAGWEIRDCVMWLYGCLSEDTEILVDGRWEPYHKDIVGRSALCYDVEHDTYSWQTIEDLFVYDYADTAYRIVSDSTDQIVSRNHRCIVEQDGAFSFRFAEEVAREREARVPVLEDLPALLRDLPMPKPPRSASQPDREPDAVCEQPRPQTVRGVRHTRTDLARVELVYYVGKVWCVKVPTGAFVARRNGKVFVTGNSGFPKSHDISKAIDKAAGAARKQVQPGNAPAYQRFIGNTRPWMNDPDHTIDDSHPITDAAKTWNGWGTSLKPAWEPIIVAMKPLDREPWTIELTPKLLDEWEVIEGARV